MKLSTVMVLPSLYEGFPIVLSEASILRLPVIGSNKAIPQEIFDDVKSWKNYVYNNIVFFQIILHIFMKMTFYWQN